MKILSELRKRLSPEQRRLRRAYDRCNCGMSYGWWVCHKGNRIADLTWIGDADHFHFYRLRPFSEEFQEFSDSLQWNENEDICIESRYAIGFTTREFFSSCLQEDPEDPTLLILPLKFAKLPLEEFARAEKFIQRFLWLGET